MFTHLQVMTTNSLMKSTLTISDLLQQAKRQGHRALALTDHDSLRGIIEFYEEAIKLDIKPIIGLTLNVEGVMQTNRYFPLVLIAKNIQGYEKLIQLSTAYYLNDEQPVKLSDIILFSEDLIVISPDTDGEIMALIDTDDFISAEKLVQYLKDHLKNYYLGLSLQNKDDKKLLYKVYNLYKI